jgi:hypothetical protein
MDISNLTRDAKSVLSALKELPNNSVVTTKACKIQIPKRFASRNLAVIGIDIYIPGIYVLIMEDNKYAVSTITSQIKINPFKTLETTIEDVDYYEFYFEAGQVLFENINLVKKDTLFYYIFDEIITKANVPWFLEYEDLGKIFDYAAFYAGSNIGENPEVTELIISLTSRDAINKMNFYRHTVKNRSYLKTNPPEYVALNSVIYSASSTLNKIAGSYVSDGIVSALVDTTTEASKIEKLLRA